MKRWSVGAAAAAAVMAMAAPAGAAPTNAKKAITFPDTFCVDKTVVPDLAAGAVIRNLTVPVDAIIVTDFVVNGNGRAGAHTAVGIVHPLSLEVTVNGEPSPEDSFVKKNVGKADWICQGETTFATPQGPVTIAFMAFATIS